MSYVASAAATDWYEHAGDSLRRFEAAFAAHTGRTHAVALPSCTSAIHLALLARGVGPGDEVIVPDITWIATAAPITYVGATPVFVDVDEQTWCIDVDAVRAALTPRTSAVIPVDLYGGMPDLDGLADVVGDDVMIIEDAAEAVGATLGGRPAGSFGDASVFSFHGSKTLTTGEGGMLVTDDDALDERVRVLQDHGRPRGATDFVNVVVAHKYKMSSVQAALGLAQLERLDELVARKRAIFGWYHERLGDRPELTMNAEPPGVRNAYWMVTVLVDPALGLEKEALRAGLAARDVDSRPFFTPLSMLPAYAETESARRAAGNVVARRLSPYGINLPSALRLTEADVDRACIALDEVVRG